LTAASLVTLVVAWIVAPAGPRPPLYDGVGFPDEPYRYVDAPAGTKPTQPPTGAVDIEPVNTAVLTVVSQEQGPQVQAQIPTTSLTLPPGATRISARFQPLAPTPPLPPDGTIWGNVYRLTMTSSEGPVGIQNASTSDHVPYIDLRAPTADQPAPVIEAYVLSAWHRLPTNRDGNDIYGAKLIGVGDYAVVRLTHPDAANSQSDSNTAGHLFGPALLIILGVLMLNVIAVLAIRYARRSAHQTPPPRKPGSRSAPSKQRRSRATGSHR
jgi:hypothetical protein